MAEDQPQSIADRIAALKLNQVGQTPLQSPPSYSQTTNNANSPGRPKPPPPPRPSLPARPALPKRSNTASVPPAAGQANGAIGNLPQAPAVSANANGMDGISRPALPPRTSTQSLNSPSLPPRRPSDSPALPPRRPSEAPSTGSRRQSQFSVTRKASSDSISSIATARSGTSAISNGTSVTSAQSVKAPAFDPSTLPALPPKRTQEEKEATYKKYNHASANANRFPLRSTKSTQNVLPPQTGTTPPPPPRPVARAVPGLPQRAETVREESATQPEPLARPLRQITAPPPRKSALSFGMNKETNTAPPVPTVRPGSVPQTDGGAAPPPIPAASKPDLSALQASKPKLNGDAGPSQPSNAGSCLLCRDFSAADNHAARFPRESIPSQDLGWLAQQLTAPFPSHTDKARVIFTWLHHNIAYDTVAFFNNNVKPSTPQSTLGTGLAVCEGYAGLFAALAMKVGLEAYVVGGHGKGYGYSKLQPGQPIPPQSQGHAWNVVKMDGGQWKLIDCCWGAGAVSGKGQPYKKGFVPMRFTQSNEDFGLDHFPQDSSKQFRSDGRVIGWEEYITGNKEVCGANFFDGFISNEGLTSKSFQPISNPIVPAQQPGPTIRFSFQKKCPHWDPVRCGKGPYYLYILKLSNLEGSKRNDIPFETTGDVWWCDVPVADLGGPGSKASIWAVTSFDGVDGERIRGLTIQRYRERRQWCSPGSGGVCMWDIA